MTAQLISDVNADQKQNQKQHIGYYDTGWNDLVVESNDIPDDTLISVTLFDFPHGINEVMINTTPYRMFSAIVHADLKLNDGNIIQRDDEIKLRLPMIAIKKGWQKLRNRPKLSQVEGIDLFMQIHRVNVQRFDILVCKRVEDL